MDFSTGSSVYSDQISQVDEVMNRREMGFYNGAISVVAYIRTDIAYYFFSTAFFVFVFSSF